MSTYADVQAMLTAKFDVKPDLIKPDAKLIELGLDSLSVAELIFDIGEMYGIEIPDDGATFQTTLADAIALVDQLRAAKAA